MNEPKEDELVGRIFSRLPRGVTLAVANEPKGTVEAKYGRIWLAVLVVHKHMYEGHADSLRGAIVQAVTNAVADGRKLMDMLR